MDEIGAGRSGDRYTAKDIEVVSLTEAIRRRPGMYIGATDTHGLHNMLWSVLGYGLNRCLARAIDCIRVRLSAGGSATVATRGKGVPRGRGDGSRLVDALRGSPLQRPWIGARHYRSAGDFSDDILYAVPALSSRLVVDTRYRPDQWRHQEYERGDLRLDTARAGHAMDADTVLTFWPDTAILTADEFNYELIVDRLRTLCYLNPGLTIEATDARSDSPRVCSFRFPDGLSSYVRHLNADRRTLHPPIFLSGLAETTRIEVALQYASGDSRNVLTYVNNHCTWYGGPHLEGFAAALTRVVRTRGRGTESVAYFRLERSVPTWDDVTHGLAAVISLWMEEPIFKGNVQGALGNPDVKDQVRTVVQEGLSHHFAAEPRALDTIAGWCCARRWHRLHRIVRRH